MGLRMAVPQGVNPARAVAPPLDSVVPFFMRRWSLVSHIGRLP